MSAAIDSNYEYVTARVRSRLGGLFDEDDYRDLTRMGAGEIARFMEETEYGEEMNALGSRYSGVELIEYALNRNLAENFEDVLQWSQGRLYIYVARYLRKFDAWNVKTVLRGIYSGADSETVEADLIPAGEFDREFLTQLIETGSVEQVVELLDGTIFGPGLAEAFEDYERTGLLVPLENATDRAFYETLLDRIPGEQEHATQLYHDFLEAEVDFRNLRNALRLARSEADIDPAEYYIEGGRLFSESELSQIAGNRDEIVARIRESRYAEDLDEALDALEGSDSLIRFEHALDAALLEYSEHLSYAYPLSVCPVLAYILEKERERENIRAIARGREAGLSEEEIEDELVIL